MPNNYLDLLQNDAPQPAAGNPYLDQLQSEEQARQTQMQATVAGAVGTDPERFALHKRVASYLNTRPEAVAALPEEAERAARLKQIHTNTADVPALQRKYTEADFAKLAHDDSDTLGAIGRAWRNLGTGYIGASAKAGAYDLLGVGARLGAEVLPTQMSRAEAAAVFKDKPVDVFAPGWVFAMDNLAQWAQGKSKAAMVGMSDEAKADYGGLKYATTNMEESAFSSPVKIAGDVVRSLPTTVAMALSIYLTKGAAATAERQALAQGLSQEAAKQAAVQAATRTMAVTGATSEGAVGYAQQYNQTFGQAGEADLSKSPTYLQLLAEGYTPENAAEVTRGRTAQEAGAVAGIVDAATNMVLGQFLGKVLVDGGNLPARVLKGGAQESATEAVQSAGEQLGGNIAEQRNLDPNKSLSDGVLESTIAGATAGFLTGGGFSGVFGAGQRVEKKQEEAQQAVVNAEALSEIAQHAEASKTMQRDVDTAQGYFQSLAEEGLDAVYITSEALQNSGMTDLIAQAIPEVAQQLETAAATNTDIKIPLADLMARVPGSALEQTIIPHLSAEPGGFTAATAQEYMQSGAAKELEAEIEKVMQQEQADESHKAERDQVQATIKQQLDTAGRFTPDVNQTYATMVASFYQVMGAKLGLTPVQMMQRYPLQAAAESAGGARSMDQSAIESPEFKNWFGDSKVVDAEGKPLVVYHGTGADFTEFGTQGHGKTTGTGAFFTSDPDIANTYAPSRDGAKVMPTYLSIKKPFVVDAYGASWNSITDEAFVEYTDGTQDSLFDLLGLNYETDGEVSTDDIAAYARRKGYDGVVIRSVKDRGPNSDSTFRREGDVYVAFNPEQVKSAIGNRGTFDPNDPNILNQGERGKFTFGDDITTEASVITLLKNADLSTFIHESGHFFLEVMTHMATQQDAPAPVVEDLQKVLNWFGVESIDAWRAMDLEQKRPFHEQFARGFEAYAFEGKAPSVELRAVFQRFRAWLLNVYRSIRQLNVELNDDVRGVFDRMLASSEQIRDAEAVRAMAPVFDKKPDFMDDAQWAAYQDLGTQATQEAVGELESRSLRDMKWLSNARSRKLRELQREAAEKRKAVRAEVEAEVMAEPINMARTFLKKGETIDAEGNTIKAEAGHKLDIDALKEMYPEGAIGNKPEWKSLGYGAGGMLGKNGLHPDLAAEIFGFTSGDQLVHELLTAEDPKAKIEGITDQRMLERYGDIADEQSRERAADEAIHNEARQRFVATELNAIERAIGKKPTLAKAAKQFAEAMVERLKVRDIKPNQYATAEARAQRNALDAMKKGELETVAVEKRNALVNGYATKAAYAAQEEIERGVKYLRKFDSADVRKSIGADAGDQIDALLERFDLRTSTTLKSIDERKAFAEWIESQRAQGLEPDIPPEMANEAFRKSVKEMTMEEFRGLIDTVKQIEHLGRLQHKLLTAERQESYEAARDELAASIIANAGDRKADTRTPTTARGRTAAGLKGFWASHIKVANWARILDGRKDGGPAWEYFIRQANAKGDFETRMRAEATAKLAEILSPVFKLGKMGGSGQYFESIGRALNRESRIAIALNLGNDGNIQRLLGGEGWTLEQLKPVMQTLTAAEWQAVQAIWDHFESYRPEIAAKERRVYGKEPNWVEPKPLTVKTADGQTITLKGGYYPIKYDPRASQRAEEHHDAEAAQRELRGAFTSATTRRSFTKARAEEVTGRPLLYTLAGLYSGVNDVIHDLAWHEWLIDTNRLLRSHTIDRAIREHYGPEVKEQFKTWAKDIAEGDRGANGAGERALGWLRQSVSVAGLGFNVMSAAMQPLGYTQSIVRIGAGPAARGLAKYLANPLAATREAQEKSDFMADRARTRFRELNELRNKVQDQSAFKEHLGRYAYFLMMRCQQMVDTPTWHGAYEKAINEGNDEARAIALADQAVIDAQGGGQTKDQSAIERGGPALRLFTVFYSFMNTALNVGVAQTMTANTPAKRAKLAADYLLLYVAPAVLGFALKNALTPGDSGDGDDMEELAKKLVKEEITFLMGLMVVVREFGEVAATLTGTTDRPRDYSGPAGVRMIGDAGTAAKQIRQGEFDDAFRKAMVNIIGDLFGLPAAQINRTITGAKALKEGETDNPAAVVFGFQRDR